ncbi:MAG: biopolymer transporter ExbD [Pseudomonadota bacterium]|nr:biopolymer transporter ExbD [Pseudomonadota bacterium]
MVFINRQNSDSNSRRKFYKPMADINVTPMVDVMLVLLVIFIVAAPLLTTGVEVSLPEAKSPNLTQDNEALTVSVNENFIALQDEKISINQLGERLRAISENNPEVRVYVRADKSLSYGDVMNVMSQIYKSGVSKAALVTIPEGNM